MDASSAQVLAGHPGRVLSTQLIDIDLAKWRVPDEAHTALSVVYTSNPEWYAGRPEIIAVRRHLAVATPKLPTQAAVEKACQTFGEAVLSIHSDFRADPFRFLQEKDFETELFMKMRAGTDVASNVIHPVRCQWWSENSAALGRNRRHDLVVLGSIARELALEVELKTSHSDRHNWYRTSALASEFHAMQVLKDSGSLARAVFLMFRFGPDRWRDDASALCVRFPAVEFDCRCSEIAAKEVFNATCQ
jgi:hypothetical protein